MGQYPFVLDGASCSCASQQPTLLPRTLLRCGKRVEPPGRGKESGFESARRRYFRNIPEHALPTGRKAWQIPATGVCKGGPIGFCEGDTRTGPIAHDLLPATPATLAGCATFDLSRLRRIGIPRFVGAV